MSYIFLHFFPFPSISKETLVHGRSSAFVLELTIRYTLSLIFNISKIIVKR